MSEQARERERGERERESVNVCERVGVRRECESACGCTDLQPNEIQKGKGRCTGSERDVGSCCSARGTSTRKRWVDSTGGVVT